MSAARFAPSPTGRLHLGHAYSAAIGHAAARGQGSRFLVRIDDLDRTRSRPAFVDAIFADLRWLGLDWDEPVVVQSGRLNAYADGFGRLKGMGLVYPCFCTRADIAAAIEAPHGAAGARYPGTCRGLSDDSGRRAAEPHSWRLDAAKALERAGLPSWREGDKLFESHRDDFDDVVLGRKDAAAAYHLACVVDDAASGVTLVVRGADLRASTPIQRLLQLLLDLPEPDYLHHPLVTHAGGRRLAKRDRAPTLAAMRERGVDGRALAAELLAGKLPLGFAFTDA
jgi:glutamyl-Q tRNA(Asp) synthetase